MKKCTSFIVVLFCQYANGRTIQTELMDGFMRFLDRFAKKNIHKIFFNKSEIQELQELDGKRILYFADEWDYNNQHIFHIYEKRSVISWCFREIYKKDGSHGCINLPLEAAEKLYGMIEVGVPVVMYYEEEEP